MGIAERKQRQRNDLRDKILKAAQRIVLKEGLAALTLRRVAEKIEYSPATLYLHFQNRDEILQELGRMGLEVLVGCLEESAGVDDPVARLGAMSRGYVRFAHEHAEAYRLIFMLDSETAEAVFRSHAVKAGEGDRAFRLIVEAFAALARARPEYASLDPAAAAEQLWITLHGIASLKISCGKFLQAPADALVDRAVATLLLGLRSRDTSAG